MMVNEYIKRAEEQEKDEAPKSRRRKIHEIDLKMNGESIVRILPFMLFLTAWAIVYIANRHYGVKTLREIDQIRNEIPDLKADYYTINADLSNSSIQSQVTKKVEPLGLKELTAPPKRIKLITDEQR
jgi:hypothetical protein